MTHQQREDSLYVRARERSGGGGPPTHGSTRRSARACVCVSMHGPHQLSLQSSLITRVSLSPCHGFFSRLVLFDRQQALRCDASIRERESAITNTTIRKYGPPRREAPSLCMDHTQHTLCSYFNSSGHSLHHGHEYTHPQRLSTQRDFFLVCAIR